MAAIHNVLAASRTAFLWQYTITSGSGPVNLYDLAKAAGWTPQSVPLLAVVTVNSSIYVGGAVGGFAMSMRSANGSEPAPVPGCELRLINNGYILGAGGPGGVGRSVSFLSSGYGGSNGSQGSHAFRGHPNFLMRLWNYGVMAGGGGGGGGGASGYRSTGSKEPLYYGVGGGGGGGGRSSNYANAPGGAGGVVSGGGYTGAYNGSGGGTGSVGGLGGGGGGGYEAYNHWGGSGGPGGDWGGYGGSGGGVGSGYNQALPATSGAAPGYFCYSDGGIIVWEVTGARYGFLS